MKSEYCVILMSLFICKVAAIGAGYPDSIIFLVYAVYILADKYLKTREISASYDEKFKKMEEELTKVKNSTDGMKLAVGMNKLNR